MVIADCSAIKCYLLEYILERTLFLQRNNKHQFLFCSPMEKIFFSRYLWARKISAMENLMVIRH